MFVGIDVSATRGFDVCVLDENRTVTLLLKARDLETLEPILRQFPKTTTFAVDAPSAVSKGLVTGKEHRVAEHELRKLSITLYFTPRSEDVAPSWMRAGFDLQHLLDLMGFPVFGGGEAGSGLTIEVYAHLSYVSLTGTRWDLRRRRALGGQADGGARRRAGSQDASVRAAVASRRRCHRRTSALSGGCGRAAPRGGRGLRRKPRGPRVTQMAGPPLTRF